MRKTTYYPGAWRDAPATLTDHYYFAQLQRDWQYYRHNPLIRQQLEYEMNRLAQVLGKRGGTFFLNQPPYNRGR